METTKDKRVKREIANSNERRRMQSINAGFQKLKRLLPVNDGEKISKANILQHAADFIQSIERDRLALFEQNTLIKGILMDLKNGKSANVNTILERIDLTVSPTIPINTVAAAARPSQSTGNVAEIRSDKVAGTKKRLASAGVAKASSMPKNGLPPASVAKLASPKNGLASASVAKVSSTKNGLAPANVASPKSDLAPANAAKAASPKNGLAPAGVAKAAIALPLEVPYTTDIVVTHHHETHPDATARKLLETDPTTLTTAMDSQDQPPKGQNLDTICKAIMEIEGDRVFKNEAT